MMNIAWNALFATGRYRESARADSLGSATASALAMASRAMVPSHWPTASALSKDEGGWTCPVGVCTWARREVIMPPRVPLR